LNNTETLLTEARKLFDVAGITPFCDGSVLIVGLATSLERDLDDFIRDEDRAFRLRGFETHVQPLLDSVVDFARGLGLPVEVWGTCGYPPGNELNLKRQAVAAGLGSWGKNAMVVHSQFGPRLRLASIRIAGATLDGTGPGLEGHKQNPLCRDCSACIDACPPGVVEPYYLRDRRACLANTSWSPDPGKVECCDRCWTVCPVGVTGD